MLKKKIGWVLGTIVVLGAGGYVLARFNTDSMAHVIYQQMTHPSSPSSDSKIEIKSEKDKANLFSFLTYIIFTSLLKNRLPHNALKRFELISSLTIKGLYHIFIIFF